MGDELVKQGRLLTELEMQSAISLLQSKLTIASNLMLEAAHQISVEFPHVSSALKEAATSYCSPNFTQVVGGIGGERDDD